MGKFDNRVANFFRVPTSGNQSHQVFPSLISNIADPCFPVTLRDIYQAAYDNAKRDYELNRLFNPQFYEDGDGI